MRSKSCIITDDNYYEFMVDIGNDVVRKVLSSVADIYTANYRPVPGPNHLAYNTMSISMFFDTKNSILYVTYNLDKDRLINFSGMDGMIYRTINKNLETIQRDQDFPVNIVGDPSGKPSYSIEYPFIGTSMYLPIRVDTEYMWSIIPGPKDRVYHYFIENRSTLEDNIRKNNVSFENIQKYFNKVIELNKSIDKNNPDYDQAFNQYIDLNKRYLNYTPKVIEEWRQFTIYINVRHDTIAEQFNSPDHDRGYLEERDRIKEYIRDWARKHHKKY